MLVDAVEALAIQRHQSVEDELDTFINESLWIFAVIDLRQGRGWRGNSTLACPGRDAHCSDTGEQEAQEGENREDVS